MKFLDLTGLTRFWGKCQDAFVPQTRTVNSKALSEDISLSASDVGAAASSHNHAASEITSGTISTARLPEMTAASSSSAGTAGIVPAPTSGKQNSYLRGDGTWSIPENTTYTPASATPEAVATTGAVGSSANYARQDHVHAISLATGDSNGQVKIAGSNVTVNGLGSAAFTESSAYVPATRTINSKALSANITLSASDVSAVPTTRTVNNKALSSNITLDTSDIGITAVTVSATAAGWSSSSPYTQTVAVTGVTASNNIIVGTGDGLTSAQHEAFIDGQIVCTAQAAGSITLTAFGDKPTIALPITVFIV